MRQTVRLPTSHSHRFRMYTMHKSPLLIAGFAVLTAAQFPKRPSPSTGPGELLPDEQVQQVLNRLTFGARPGDAEKVRAMGVEKWIDVQLHPQRIDDSAVDGLMSHYSVYNMKTDDIVKEYQDVQKLARQAKARAGSDTSMME